MYLYVLYSVPFMLFATVREKNVRTLPDRSGQKHFIPIDLWFPETRMRSSVLPIYERFILMERMRTYLFVLKNQPLDPNFTHTRAWESTVAG